MQRLLITGASGFLGGHLAQQAQKVWMVYGSYCREPSLPAGVHAVPLELSDGHAIRQMLNEINPAAIIHAAVLQVDACERTPKLASIVNIEASRIIAEWCAEKQRRLLYLSTDMVFDGNRGGYTETDVAQPVLRYGETKLLAEQAVLAVHSGACIARLPLMYGRPVAGGTCFFMDLLRRLERGEQVPVFYDQYRSAGWVENIAAALLELTATDYAGILHVAGAERCSREQLARMSCRLGGWDEGLLKPVSMHTVVLPAPRPADVSLDIRQAQALLKTPLLGYEEGLQRIFTS